MLKRQRPSSPLYFSPDPHESDINFDGYMPNSKRRRVLPPSLDGPSRGWGSSVAHYGSAMEEDAAEEGDEDEGDEDEASNNSQDVSSSNEYKSTNSLLHQLHAAHQHKILFNSQSTPPTSLRNPSIRINTPQAQQPASTISPLVNPILPSLRTVSAPQSFATKSTPCLVAGSMEVQSVNQRYKDVNKLLGSLVLSRRRHTGDP